MSLFRSADVVIGNLESAIVGKSRRIRGYGGLDRMWVVAKPSIAPDLRRIGFDVLTRANNHVMDWGGESLREGSRALKAAKIACPGAGEDADAANSTAFVSTEVGRVGILATTTSCPPFGRALVRRGAPQFTAGASALQVDRQVTIAADDLEALKRIAASHPMGLLGGSECSAQGVNFFGVPFTSSSTPGYQYRVRDSDHRELLNNIRKARRRVSCIVVSLHTHESGDSSTEPAGFVQDLCHDIVDAGADVVFGHGPHRLRGVELYKGRPICYSLGNFIYQTNLQNSKMFDAAGILSAAADSSEVACMKEVWRQLTHDSALLEGAAAIITLSTSGDCSIMLVPVELGCSSRTDGIPRLAVGRKRRSILMTIASLSAQFDTRVDPVSGLVSCANT